MELVIVAVLMFAFLILHGLEKYSALVVKSLSESFSYAVLVAPAHIVASLLIFFAISVSVRTFAANYYAYYLIQILTSYAAGIIMTFLILKQTPTIGHCIALLLMIAAVIIGKFVK